MRTKITTALLGLLSFIFILVTPVYASAPTDEILNYDIMVEVNDDATLDIYYYISWKVLDSDALGPLEWVQVGIPNRHTVYCQALSSSISSIRTTSSGGYYVRVDLDRKYYEGEVVDFSFKINQDNMYEVDKLKEGYTVYTFTPGWFDDINVDNMTIRWNMDNVDSFTPNCEIDNGQLVWSTPLNKGDKYTVSVGYPNDAYAFDLSKSDDDASGRTTIGETIIEIIAAIIVFFMSIAMCVGPIIFIAVLVRAFTGYSKGAGFGSTEKKVTRTKVTYYPSCQGCGAVRKEGEQFCTYCGRSFVKSEEVIKEENIKNEDKSILGFKKDGEYRYSSSPNTYIRVHTVVVPRPRPVTTSHSSSHHSSCAHSSCACACACACAGGGRAGCTNKDFYNTDLKLKQLEKKLRK